MRKLARRGGARPKSVRRGSGLHNATGVAAAGLAVGAGYAAHKTGRKIQGREGAKITRPNAPVAASTVKFASGGQSPFQRGMSAPTTSPKITPRTKQMTANVAEMKITLAKMDASREARSYHNFEPTEYFYSKAYSDDKRRASRLEAMIQEAGDAKTFTLRKTDQTTVRRRPQANNLKPGAYADSVNAVKRALNNSNYVWEL